MSQQRKVSNPFKMSTFAKLLDCSPITLRTERTDSFEHNKTKIQRKNSFRSINKFTKPETSIDFQCRVNQRIREDYTTSDIAQERKRKRKCFFEQVCGLTVHKTDPEIPKVTTPVETCGAYKNRAKFFNDVHYNSQSIRHTSTKSRAQRQYGSTSTVDSSPISIEDMVLDSTKQHKSDFFNLNIKKVNLVKNTNSRFEFVPLVDHCKLIKLEEPANQPSQLVFPTFKLQNDIQELVEDIEKWDNQWIEIDNAALGEVFCRSSC